MNADDTNIKYTSGNSENAKAGTEQSESKQTKSHEGRQREKQSPVKTKVNGNDTNIKYISGNSENAKAGTEQSESKQTESHENILGKQVNMEETKEKQNRVDSQD